MSAISIRLPDEFSEKLQHLSDLTGRTKTFYILQALRKHLDDLEDIYIAEQRLADVKAGREKIHRLKDVEKDLGLDD